MSQALLQTDAVTYQRRAPLLTPAAEARLDALLAVDPGLRVTPHHCLCQPATANTSRAINQALAKRKPKKLALTAICNKLLKQAFAIVKSGVACQANFTQKHRLHGLTFNTAYV